ALPVWATTTASSRCRPPARWRCSAWAPSRGPAVVATPDRRRARPSPLKRTNPWPERAGGFSLRVGADGESGEGGIRTLVTLTGHTVFETGAFNHSATSPAVGERS